MPTTAGSCSSAERCRARLVDVEIIEEKRDWSRGRCRRRPRAVGRSRRSRRARTGCAGCGGCDWQHLEVDRAARRQGGDRRRGDAADRRTRLTPVIVRGRVGAAVRLPHDDPRRRRPVRAGRRSARSARTTTVPVDGCLVAHPALFDVAARASRSTRTSRSRCGCRRRPAQMTAMWDTAHGDVRGFRHTVQSGAEAALNEDVAGHRFRVSAGSFFQSRSGGRRAARRRRRAGRPRAGRGRSTWSMPTAVSGCSRSPPPTPTRTIARRDLAIGGRRRPAQPGRPVRRRSCAARSAAGARRRPSIDVVIADPARSGLGKPGVGGAGRRPAPR